MSIIPTEPQPQLEKFSISLVPWGMWPLPGHNVILDIQATIPSTPEKPSKGPMWKGEIVAYIVVALCYFLVALIGYYIFGNEVDDNILITLEKPTWLITMANPDTLKVKKISRVRKS
ncbi:hypothetical protein Vadar_026973 [Vaccinium darrowii]|uniref:Uncharacterized protein n=1 Tax=Vaccinium darrowii TaxID=229202 RepID=A0ACB7YGF7_9ERIC|nr:hypothetical protein Vadar_026973 [Vaccinium darrowii]